MEGKCTMMKEDVRKGSYEDAFDDDMAPLGRDAILSVQDADVAYVAVPEWGGGVYIRTMTGAQRDALERQITGGETITRAQIAVLCCCDDRGRQLFTDDDMDALNAKSASALDRILEAAVEHNNLRGQDIEEAAKN